MAIRPLACAALLLASTTAPLARAAEPSSSAAIEVSGENDPAYVRAFVEQVIAVGLSTAFYWGFRDRNVADWDNPSLRARLNGQAWVYDNNDLPVNFALHPATGMGAYLLARGNGLSFPVAYAYAFFSSFAWETAVEFKEKISINDVLVTPTAGMAMGEFFHKLGLYLDSTPDPGFFRSTLQWSPLGLSVRGHRAIDGRDVPTDRPRDSLGLARGIWHAFEVDAGVASVWSTRARQHTRYGYGFAGHLVTLPGYLRDGSFSRFFHRAELSSFDLQAEHSVHGNGLSFAADTVLLGGHIQQIRGAGRARHGIAATVGTSLGLRYRRSLAAGVDEQLGALHLPGLAIDWHAMMPGVVLSVRGRASADFVGAGASAYADWEAANPDEVGKSILRKQGYFFGWGGSARVRASLNVGPFSLRGRVFYGRYTSDEGQDRAPELVTIEVPADAEHLEYGGALLLSPPEVPVAVGPFGEGRRYRSWVGGFSRTERIMAQGVTIVGHF